MDVRDLSTRRYRELAIVVSASVAVSLALLAALVTADLWAILLSVTAAIVAAGMVVSRNFGRAVLWGLLFANLFITDIGVVRDSVDEAQLHPQLLVKLAIYLATPILSMFWIRASAISRGGVVVVGYLALCGLSAAYSVDRLLSISAVMILVSQASIGLALVSSYRDVTDVWSSLALIRICVLVKVLASWAIAFTSPTLGFGEETLVTAEGVFAGFPRLWGLAGPNITGFNAAVLTVLSLPECLRGGWRNYRRLHPYAFAVGMVTLAATQSRACIISAIVAMVAVVVSTSGRKLLVMTGLAVVLSGVAWEWGLGDIARLTSRVGSEEEALTLNGRTRLWAGTLDRVEEAPFFGFGYGSGRALVPTIVIPLTTRRFYSAHNVVFESLLNVGIVGTLFLVAILATFLWKSLLLAESATSGSPQERVGGALLALAVLTAVNGIAESGVAGIQTVQGVLVFWGYLTTLWLDANRRGERVGIGSGR